MEMLCTFSIIAKAHLLLPKSDGVSTSADFVVLLKRYLVDILLTVSLDAYTKYADHELTHLIGEVDFQSNDAHILGMWYRDT